MSGVRYDNSTRGRDGEAGDTREDRILVAIGGVCHHHIYEVMNRVTGVCPLLLVRVGSLCHALNGFIQWLEFIPRGDG